MNKSVTNEESLESQTPRTTIGLKKATKDRLDRNRAPGQCYDGFLGQMVDLWEKAAENSGSRGASSARGNRGS
jgi:hypothetical protein